ncbi:hypothetical protein [Actinacidiphila paucisporea]|uniref:Uncharacterized protein n=1 Tax=Actinacidiphila paucisporea TaxID=310782 RepID=A0A1M7DFD2_9ACTN|nr:hypothetical protein [Actinacidiphila paucisporea]SHL78182.1 hypothetical protein SAMN05216499_10657 [Actinacidiphila paucisporea]
MSIDWHALGTVLAVTLLSTVGLVGVFTLGVVGLARPAAAAARGGAYVCFAACAAAVAWGIWLIVAK